MDAHYAGIFVQVLDEELTGSDVTAGFIWMKPYI